MSRISSQVGDSHNFGRRVSVRGTRVDKPRTVAWERLLLSAKSPLRKRLAVAARGDSLGRGVFDFLPDLAFFPGPTPFEGQVEQLRLVPLPRLDRGGRRSLARITGRALALFSFLGLSDLHWENLALGADARGRVVFTPLDVEMILADFSSPAETKLLPDADPEYAALCRHACGVRRVLPHLGKPVDRADLVAMAGAYRAMLLFLERHADEIARVFIEMPGLRDVPIRLCLRSTGDYVRARTEPLVPPLLDAESEQLARGDIPYFFRLYGRPGIHYYRDASLEAHRRIPFRDDGPRLEPMLSLARLLRSPSRRRLREDGLFTVLGAFDDPSYEGVVETEELRVSFGRRALVITSPEGEELETRRALGRFVGSVYLPCRCGEVRSVFVPRVTTCEPEGARSRAEDRWARRSGSRGAS